MIAEQIIAEFRALGMWCVIHGAEIWLACVALAIFCGGIVLGMWLASLFSANGRDDIDRQRK